MSTVLFVDAENIKLEQEDFMFLKQTFHIDQILVYVSKSFSTVYREYHPCLELQVMEIVTCFKKNTIDIQISTDIVESLFIENFDNYLIASHDRDYLPVFEKLRAAKKQVIVIGRDVLSERIQNSVDNIFLMNSLDAHLRILLKSFFLRNNRSGKLSLTELKKNIKKLNYRKQLTEEHFKNLPHFIEDRWHDFFWVEKRAQCTKIFSTLLCSKPTA